MLAASAAALLSLSVPVSGQTRDSVSMSPDGNESKASVYFKDGKFNVRSRDGKFHLWLDNRIYTDASFYFPMQNRENTVPSTSSEVTSPQISPIWCRASRMSCVTNSVETPARRASRARVRASKAFWRAW